MLINLMFQIITCRIWILENWYHSVVKVIRAFGLTSNRLLKQLQFDKF